MREIEALNNSCLASPSRRLRTRNSCSQNRRRSSCSHDRVCSTSLVTSSSTGFICARYTTSSARKDSMASTEVIWACCPGIRGKEMNGLMDKWIDGLKACPHPGQSNYPSIQLSNYPMLFAALRFSLASSGRSSLVEILLDALGLAQQERRVFLGQLGEFFERLHRLLELLGKFFMLLVRPGVAQRRKPRVEQHHAVFDLAVEALQFLGEPPHFFRIHDGLRHNFLKGCVA